MCSLQSRTNKKSSSVYSFRTQRPVHLPVVDARLGVSGGVPDALVGVELGPVCYSR